MPKIKKLKVAALIWIILSVCFVFIGLPLIGHAWRKNHPDTYPSVIPANQWKFFASAEGRFHILFPGKPDGTNKVVSNPANKITLHSFYVWTEDKQSDYAVLFNDIPTNVIESSPGQLFDISQNGVEEKYGRIAGRRDFIFDGFPARDFEFVAGGKGNFSGQIRYILVDQRLYQIMVIFLTKNPHPDDFKIFFDSFSLSKEAKQ